MKSRKLNFMDYPGYKVKTNGTVWSKKTGVWKKLKPVEVARKTGYRTVTLHNKTGQKTYFIHTLVLEAFVGPCPPGKQCCHFPDRDPSNNRKSNLSWGTSKRNAKHRDIHGNSPYGERNGRAILNWKKVRKIRRLFKKTKNYPQRDKNRWTYMRLALRFKISLATIKKVLSRKHWGRSPRTPTTS